MRIRTRKIYPEDISSQDYHYISKFKKWCFENGHVPDLLDKKLREEHAEFYGDAKLKYILKKWASKSPLIIEKIEPFSKADMLEAKEFENIIFRALATYTTNTIQSYMSIAKRFYRWAKSCGIEPLPLKENMIDEYINTIIANGISNESIKIIKCTFKILIKNKESPLISVIQGIK